MSKRYAHYPVYLTDCCEDLKDKVRKRPEKAAQRGIQAFAKSPNVQTRGGLSDDRV